MRLLMPSWSIQVSCCTGSRALLLPASLLTLGRTRETRFAGRRPDVSKPLEGGISLHRCAPLSPPGANFKLRARNWAAHHVWRLQGDAGHPVIGARGDEGALRAPCPPAGKHKMENANSRGGEPASRAALNEYYMQSVQICSRSVQLPGNETQCRLRITHTWNAFQLIY